MKTKRKGSRNELKTMRLFEGLGYRVCKAGGSLGVFDLIAISPTDIIACQVKSNRPPPPAEMDEIRNFRCPANCRKLVHVWKDYQKQPIVMEV